MAHLASLAMVGVGEISLRAARAESKRERRVLAAHHRPRVGGRVVGSRADQRASWADNGQAGRVLRIIGDRRRDGYAPCREGIAFWRVRIAVDVGEIVED